MGQEDAVRAKGSLPKVSEYPPEQLVEDWQYIQVVEGGIGQSP